MTKKKVFFKLHLVLEQAADERLGSWAEGVGQAVVAVKDVVLRGRPGCSIKTMFMDLNQVYCRRFKSNTHNNYN